MTWRLSYNKLQRRSSTGDARTFLNGNASTRVQKLVGKFHVCDSNSNSFKQAFTKRNEKILNGWGVTSPPAPPSLIITIKTVLINAYHRSLCTMVRACISYGTYKLCVWVWVCIMILVMNCAIALYWSCQRNVIHWWASSYTSAI